MNREDSFDAGGWRACIDLFWSRSDVSRSRSCHHVSLVANQDIEHYLSLFLEVEGIDLLQLSLLKPWLIYPLSSASSCFIICVGLTEAV